MLVLINISHTEPKGYLRFDDEYFYPDSIAHNGLNTTTREEYEPRWVGERPAYTPLALWGEDSQVKVSARRVTATSQSFEVAAAKPVLMHDTAFYYPGWTAMVDGREVTISPQPVTGLITFDLPAGIHQVTLTLRPTPIRAAARRFSIDAALALIAILIAGALAHTGVVRVRLPRAIPRRIAGASAQLKPSG